MRFLCYAALALATCLCGCSFLTPTPPEWKDAAVNLQWPPAPDAPRIRYLRGFSGAAEFKDQSKTQKFATWLTGDEGLMLPFVSPYGIAADGKGRIWVADMGIPAVHLIDLGRKKVDYLFTAGKHQLVTPAGIAIDPERSRLYLSDTTLARVFVLDLDGRYQAAWNAPDGFGRPAGLAVDRTGNLYVVDAKKNRLSVFSPQGVHLRDIASGAPPEFGFHTPSNVAVDDQGRIFVTDSLNFRVESFAADGKSLGTIGAIGDGPGYFARPRGVAVDGDGHVYVVDATFNNIQVFDNRGRLLIYFGQSGTKAGEFSLPSGLFIDRENRIYVSDSYNQRIQIFEYLPDPEHLR